MYFYHRISCSIIVSYHQTVIFVFYYFSFVCCFCKYMFINLFAFSLFAWYYFKGSVLTLLVCVHSEL